MKKILAILLALLLAFALVGCNRQGASETPDGNLQDPAGDGAGNGQTSGNQDGNTGVYGTGADL